jgi:small neutral amino acid transporter SnatA (MarC family)
MRKGDARARPATRVWRAGLLLALLAVISFGALAPPERCPRVSAADLRRSAQSAVGWFVHNQRPDGTWVYLYDARANSTPPEYNVVRHAGVTMGLYQAAAAGLPGALRSADRGTGWALDMVRERDDWSAIASDGQSTTGATALLVAGLAIRREATGDTRYDGVLRRLGRFLLEQVEPSGAVAARYDWTGGAPVRGEHSKYYTGEAYWALALLHRAFPEEEWGAAADRVGAYLATARDDAEGHWPPIADHWAGYGLAETATFPERGRPPLTEAELAYARRQAELFGAQARWVQQRFGPWGGVVRGSPVPRGGGYGVIDEGFAGLWRAASIEPRLADIREPIAERATCIAGLAVREQADAADAAAVATPARVQGAWFLDGVTRMDDQQHALAGLLRTIAIVESASTGGPIGSDDDAPSAWLWAAALLLALNPPRAAWGIPRSGRSRREVAWLAAAGGAIGGLAVCAVAALADGLLDALDASAPALRAAAGIVALPAGAGDLLGRPPAAEPALAGRRAALVPVAVPLIARPALLLLALGAGADHGVPVVAAAMAVGVATATGLAARCPNDGPGGRVLHWAVRVLAAGLVACGVLLAIDGILAV